MEGVDSGQAFGGGGGSIPGRSELAKLSNKRMKNRRGARKEQAASLWNRNFRRPTYEISIENGALAPDCLKLLKAAPPSATRETARHVRNWKATDVDNVNADKSCGISRAHSNRRKVQRREARPPLPLLFLCKFSPRRGKGTEVNRDTIFPEFFFRFRNVPIFFFFFFAPFSNFPVLMRRC